MFTISLESHLVQQEDGTTRRHYSVTRPGLFGIFPHKVLFKATNYKDVSRYIKQVLDAQLESLD